ncbi:hypothetical protein ACRQ5Q_11090 [Bradyrhizobium sp. PMVTL-01]|uniref:hypothetical protein n=1 Tax=Bradyrhizobium sp. PMVTL-01 TaxID=3434999 RepID=UPI003F71B51F
MVLVFVGDGAAFSLIQKNLADFLTVSGTNANRPLIRQCVRWARASRLALTSNFIWDASRKRHG